MNFVLAKVLQVALAASALAAGFGGVQEVVGWDYSVEPETARKGEAVTVTLTAEIDPDWYMYAHTLEAKGPLPTRFKFDLPEGLSAIGGIEAPEPETKFDEGFQVNVQIYHDKVTFAQKVLVGSNVTAVTVPIEGSIRFQTCSGTKCLPPKTVTFSLDLAIEEGPARDAYKASPAALAPAPQSPGAPTPETGEAQPAAASGSVSGQLADARSAGFFVFLLLAIAQGFLALLTPCVYPMIPITISYFLHEGEKEGRKPFFLATAYAGSIIVTFTAVGLLLAAFVGPAATSRFGASMIANLFLAALFLAFALNLFGMFEIRIPARLQNYLSGKGRSGGYAGTAFMGLAFTIASLTCTAPFIGALLGLTVKGDWFWPIVGMVGFSSAFSLPFFFLALFPQYLGSMPKSGGWLNSVKVVMGFLVLAVALKFLSNVDAVRDWGVFTRPVVLASWAMICVFIGIYLLGKIQLPHDSPIERLGVQRMLLSLVFLTFGLYLSTGLFGGRLGGAIDTFLPAPTGGYLVARSAAEAGGGEKWVDNFDDALERARVEQKPVFVDFSGITCTNCKWMERNIFTKADVRKSFQEFILARLMTDTGPRQAQHRKMQVERFGTAVLPLYAIVSPDDEILGRFEGMTSDVDRFVAFLKEGLTAHRSGT